MGMNEEVRKSVISATEREMMDCVRGAHREIILKCAETLDCEHSRETIARRLIHDSGLWNELWESPKEKRDFWVNYVESIRETDYKEHLISLDGE